MNLPGVSGLVLRSVRTVVSEARDAVVAAAGELTRANDAVAVARRALSAAVAAAYRAGVPVARIGEDSGLGPVGVRNLLDAVGEPRRRR